MNFLSHRTDEGITLIYEKYADTVYKVCFMLIIINILTENSSYDKIISEKEI